MKVRAFTFQEVLDLPFPPAEIAARVPPKEADCRLLLEAIGNVGLLNIPTVYDIGGILYVGDGSRRFTALKLAIKENHEKVMARYPEGIMEFPIETKSDSEAALSQIIGNIHSKPQTNAEYAKALYRAIVIGGKSREGLAADLGITIVKLDSILSLVSLPDSAQKLLKEGQMSLTNAIALARLPKTMVTDELITDAAAQNTEQFATKVNESLEEMRKTARALRPASEAKVFKAQPKLVAKDSLLKKLEQAQFSFDLDASEANRVRLEVLKEIFSLDEVTVAAAKAQWEKDNENKEKEALKREKDRNDKRNAEIQASLGNKTESDR